MCASHWLGVRLRFALRPLRLSGLSAFNNTDLNPTHIYIYIYIVVILFFDALIVIFGCFEGFVCESSLLCFGGWNYGSVCGCKFWLDLFYNLFQMYCVIKLWFSFEFWLFSRFSCMILFLIIGFDLGLEV